MQIGVVWNPHLEHVFGQLLRHLAHNNWRSRVERRSTTSRSLRQSSAIASLHKSWLPMNQENPLLGIPKITFC